MEFLALLLLTKARFPLFPLEMKWTLKPSLCFCMRKSHCKAFLLVLFCSFAPVVNADETDTLLDPDVALAVTNLAVRVNGLNASQVSVDDTVSAILSLLQSVRNMNGNTSFRTVPYAFVGGSGSYTSAGLGYVLSRALAETTLDQDSSRQQSFLYEIQRALYGASGVPAQNRALIPLFDERTSSLVALLSTNFVTPSQLSDELNTLSQDHLGFLDYLGGYTYTDSSELRVHDDGLNELVSNMVFDAGGLGADMSSALSQLIGISQDLEYIRGQFEAEASLPVSNIVRDAQQSTEDEYDDALEEALDEYDSIPLPTSEEDYQTDAADPDGPTSSDVFGNINTSVSHSALLTLTTGPATRSSSSIIPAIEIDFGRDAGFVSFCLRLNDLTDWLYPILGTLFLSLKGLGMWRLVRQASTFASAKGDLPNMHLAWNPF